MRAYADIIQALHHIKRDLEICLSAEMQRQDTDTDFHKEWDAKNRAAWDELRKYVDIGEFLFSPESLNVLQGLMSDKSGPSDSYYEHLETLQTAVNKCLPAIKATARVDLKLPSR